MEMQREESWLGSSDDVCIMRVPGRNTSYFGDDGAIDL